MHVLCLSLYAVLSVPCGLVITCWKRAGLLALLCVVFSCALVSSVRPHSGVIHNCIDS